MTPPFTAAQFFEVFVRYNDAVWPAPYVLSAIGVLAFVFAVARGRYAGRIVAGLVGFLWLWAGVVYHWLHFTSINHLAWIFGALFVLQAALLGWVGVVRNQLHFKSGWSVGRIAGSVVVGYALAVYPALGYLLGHRHPAAPTFGAPCPVTLFSLGVLAMLDGPPARVLLVIPVLWALVGTTAAFQFGMREDLALLVAASVSLGCAWRRPKRDPLPPAPAPGTCPQRAGVAAGAAKELL